MFFLPRTGKVSPKNKVAPEGRRIEKRDIMKSKAVISEIEKSLPVKLRPCRYCRGEPELTVREDVNYRG